jgi:hypothetical protein
MHSVSFTAKLGINAEKFTNYSLKAKFRKFLKTAMGASF